MIITARVIEQRINPLKREKKWTSRTVVTCICVHPSDNLPKSFEYRLSDDEKEEYGNLIGGTFDFGIVKFVPIDGRRLEAQGSIWP